MLYLNTAVHEQIMLKVIWKAAAMDLQNKSAQMLG